MPIVLYIEKSGSIKEWNIKDINPEELYKKVSYKTPEGFGMITKWSKPGKYNISLYGKKTGRAGNENKYDFPPPADEELLFGGLLLINQTSDGSYCDLTKQIWLKIYEDLFGGFEDIGSEDSDSDSESESDSEEDVPKTKEGYKKDGFVVEESESEEESDSDSEEESDDSDDSDLETDSDDDSDDSDLETDESDDSDDDLDIDEDEEDDSDDDIDLDDEDDVPKPKKKPAATPKQKTPVKLAPPLEKKVPKKKQKVEIPEPEALLCSDELEEEDYIA